MKFTDPKKDEFYKEMPDLKKKEKQQLMAWGVINFLWLSSEIEMMLNFFLNN